MNFIKPWEKTYPRQLGNVYEDTKRLIEYLKANNLLKNNAVVADIGCGGGTRTIQVAEAFPAVKFLGIDQYQEIINLAASLKDVSGNKNCTFEKGCWFDLARFKGLFDLIFSVHMLCCFKNSEKALTNEN